MDLTSHQFLLQAAQFILVVALSFVVVCLLTMVLRGEAQAAAPPADNWMSVLARRIAAARQQRAELAILLVAPRVGQDLRALDAAFRPRLRRADAILAAGPDRLGLVMECARVHVAAIVERVRSGVGNADFTVGWASHPEEGQHPDQLDQAAKKALETALEKHAPCWPPTASAGPGEDAVNVIPPNRLMASLQKFDLQCRDADVPLAILRLDIDFLRRYNEQYGREAGDLLLRECGVLLRRNLRATDVVGRGDDDEFMVAMACSVDSAMGAAQRLLAALRKATFMFGKAGLKMTVSIGVAGAPAHGAAIRPLLEQAAAALQAAKSRGQGMAVEYEPALRPAQKTGQPTDVF